MLLDTKFVPLMFKSFVKFSKSSKKESFRFQPSLCEYVVGDCPIAEVNGLYFPFNFYKQHWVGVRVDCSLSQVILLDCNTSQMFLHLLRQAGKQLSAKDLKTLTIERPRSVPQNYSQFDFGITAILLIQDHVVGGVDVCKCITSDVVEVEVKRIAVMIYEENRGVL